MNGVPANLPLDRIIGRDLEAITLRQYLTNFHFDGGCCLGVEGNWQLADESGSVVDENRAHDERECYRLHRILGIPVIRYAINPPNSFTLFFRSGHALTIYDQVSYETFNLDIPGEKSIAV